MKKKLIFVSEALWIGGIETALVNLLNRLDYEKYEVTLLLRRAIFDGDMRQKVPQQCRVLTCDRESGKYRFARLYHLTEEATNPSRLHRCLMWAVPAIKWMENQLYIRYVREQMKHECFDTCVIYSDVTAETAVRAIRADKFLLFYHHGAMKKVWHDEIGYKKAEKIITVSERTVEMLKQFRPKYADKVTVVHNLIDIPGVLKKAEEIPDISFPKEHFNLVTCGRLSEAKGIDWAVEACRLLMEWGHDDIHWWIVGGGQDEEKLKSQITKAGVSDHFHMLGMKSNPYPYIAAADLYVQPSRFENYSMVILEAMVLARPILATIPAAQIQIQSGQNGLLCEPSPEGIAKGIEYLYNHREEMEHYSRYLRKNSLDRQNAGILMALEKMFDGE